MKSLLKYCRALSAVALPVIVTSVAGYLAVAGGVISAVSQLTTKKADGTQ